MLSPSSLSVIFIERIVIVARILHSRCADTDFPAQRELALGASSVGVLDHGSHPRRAVARVVANNQRKQQSEYQSERWMYNWQHTSGLDSRLLAEVDYSDISDPYYFQDLRTDLNVSRPAYLNQRGSFDDLPLAELRADFERLYPNWQQMQSADFEHEVQQEARK